MIVALRRYWPIHRGASSIARERWHQSIGRLSRYWRLELIDISEFVQVADPDYPNRSMKAHPIVHYFNRDRDGDAYFDVLDGLHRIAMARARGETKILAWVAYDRPIPTEES